MPGHIVLRSCSATARTPGSPLRPTAVLRRWLPAFLPMASRSPCHRAGMWIAVVWFRQWNAAPHFHLPYKPPGCQPVYTGGGSAARRTIGGTKPQQSTFLLDGMEISTPSEGMPATSVLGQQLGVEAIREFVLLQNNYGAQYGRASGGVVNAVTQSGSNSIHGSVFEFLRNEKLDARDYFLDRRLPKAPLKRNQFGAAVGGPIRKDRTFFFLN